MNLTAGSVVSFTPDRGRIAHFTRNGEDWTLPVIGWAVVVTWTSSDDGEPDPDSLPGQLLMETGVQPVILAEDQFPVPLQEYLRDAAGTQCLCITNEAGAS